VELFLVCHQQLSHISAATVWAGCSGGLQRAMSGSWGKRWLCRCFLETEEEREQLPEKALIRELTKLPPELVVTTEYSPGDIITKVAPSFFFLLYTQLLRRPSPGQTTGGML